MGPEGVVPGPSLSKPRKGRDHTVYPYLPRGVGIERPQQVWSTDSTCIPMPRYFLNLTAIVDWCTGFLLSREISNSLDNSFCREALSRALSRYGWPEIFNTDQAGQFTAHSFTSIPIDNGIANRMDDRGRALDNVVIERFWRSYKHLYLCLPENGAELYSGTEPYMRHFNTTRPPLLAPRREPSGAVPGECLNRGAMPATVARAPRPLRLRRGIPKAGWVRLMDYL